SVESEEENVTGIGVLEQQVRAGHRLFLKTQIEEYPPQGGKRDVAKQHGGALSVGARARSWRPSSAGTQPGRARFRGGCEPSAITCSRVRRFRLWVILFRAKG